VFSVPDEGATQVYPSSWTLRKVEQRETLQDKDRRLQSDATHTYLVLTWSVANHSNYAIHPDNRDVALLIRETPDATPAHVNPDGTATAILRDTEHRIVPGGWLGGETVHLDETRDFSAVWRVPRQPASLEWNVAGSLHPQDVLPHWQAAQQGTTAGWSNPSHR
jgi:hypothetical protein